LWCCEDEGSGWPSAKNYRKDATIQYFRRDLFGEMSDIFSEDSMHPSAMDTILAIIDEWMFETKLPILARVFKTFPLPLYNTEMDRRRPGVDVESITFSLMLLYIKERFCSNAPTR
jgi:hypothetical protein